MINETDFLIPQKLPDQYTNSYYTLGVLYEGEKKYGVKWNEFRKMYIEEGGDGFYGAWSVPYLEPAIKGRNFVRRYPEIYKNINYENNRCPIAEDIQKRLMQFKTNYRDHRIAKRKAASLKRTIQKLDKSF